MSPGSRRASAAAASTLAGLTLLACVRPGAAQQDLGSVVCVASELESLASSGPVRRVIRRDTELVYRVGVDLSSQAEAERTLRAELESSGEVSCAWSQPGQSHVVAVSYNGVVRQDLMIDPEDPRYQSFAVGYGTSWEEAEQFATTVNDHFATNYYDGGGYEVLVRETWGAARPQATQTSAGSAPSGASANPGARARPEAPSTAPTAVPSPVAAGETCAGKPEGSACWMETSNVRGCYLWNPNLRSGETITWTGGCSGGYAQGNGMITWAHDEGVSLLDWMLRDGKPHGDGVEWEADGEVLQGPYVDGKRHGDWVRWWTWSGNGNEYVSYCPYVDGEVHGPRVICQSSDRDSFFAVTVYERGLSTGNEYYGHDDIQDRQLARTAAAACVRVLSLAKPSPRRNP
ncbi:hypothetical protein [Candidatus Palauibacter sp.]|uniref:hypothetical protein n=1 Tax=Candidatus Palauibacter sp. TaxID=3101350 RepID=UPI003AF25454